MDAHEALLITKHADYAVMSVGEIEAAKVLAAEVERLQEENAELRDGLIVVECDGPEHAELAQARARLAVLEPIAQRAREVHDGCANVVEMNASDAAGYILGETT
ncbi:MAG TPA: hypothetical protein VK735_18825 [Pseudonocardia sp.]|uniref:hypothetical protein n=1 Tax=Pseudonocardia sp. TaxID=60912 RepID=UPI002C9D8BC3|nr:hypothetical protein [Pseudonocardia sp.]HTF49502.1 hypothetical protein [Pseudonocardia sp.]